MYAHVSREEWLFRGLAIAMVLAMVGMAVMPLAIGSCKLGNYIVFSNEYSAWEKAIAATEMIIATQLVSEVGLMALVAAGPIGWIGIGAYVGILL